MNQYLAWLLLFWSCTPSMPAPDPPLPNLVIIYADDMGYGDLNCQNPQSKIPTPHLDQLAAEGMRFTDAHSSSGICSPSRFALLTGIYHWRRQHDIVGAFGAPFFKDTDFTLPQMLKQKGYSTACIGKWHLGWNWTFKHEPSGEVEQWGKLRKFYLPEDIDWTVPITGGPNDRGFDFYFGDGTINFPPYAWMENNTLTEIPTETMDINNVGYETHEGAWEFRPGPKVSGWNPYQVLPSLTTQAVDWIYQQKSSKQPFFLYLALPSPHAPIIPNDEFIQKSAAGGYGDFMYQTDWVAGQVLEAIKTAGLEQNTLIIFSSDNGPERYAFERAGKYQHFSMGEFRGLKRDVWEGGHHVPFIIKWPGKVPAATISEEVISQVDVMATVAEIVGFDLPDSTALDSYSLLDVMLENPYPGPLREATVHNTFENIWAIRKGKWLFIDGPTGEHSKMPDSFKELRGYSDFETAGLLFDMDQNPGQTMNLINEHAKLTSELAQLLHTYRQQGYSRPPQ
jgi:arylsulfatase A-like enzyme